MSLGTDLAAQVLKHFPDEQVEILMAEMYGMGRISADIGDQVLDEFLQTVATTQYTEEISGGQEYLQELLVAALGEEKAEDILQRAGPWEGIIPFHFLRDADSTQVARFLGDEHPQTVALVLAHLRPTEAARVLANLNPNIQADVAARIAIMESTSPEIVKEIEEGLKNKLTEILPKNKSAAGGVDYLVKVLNQVDRATEKVILESLAANDPSLAEQVLAKMFVFEDLIHVDDRSLQQINQRVDQKDLLMALRGASEELRSKIFNNMSSRARKLMEDDLAAMGPVRLRNVEEAQQRVVGIVRLMEEAEEIVISRGDGAGEVLI